MKKILVVDDEQGVREVLGAILASLNYSVVAVASGAEALTVLEAGGEGFDLVVTDVMMPGMKGNELLRKIKEFYPNLPVVVITGYSVLSPSKLKEMGASGLLAKPFKFAEVKGLVKSVLCNCDEQGPCIESWYCPVHGRRNAAPLTQPREEKIRPPADPVGREEWDRGRREEEEVPPVIFDPKYSLDNTRYMDGTVEVKRGHEGEGERIPFR